MWGTQKVISSQGGSRSSTGLPTALDAGFGDWRKSDRRRAAGAERRGARVDVTSVILRRSSAFRMDSSQPRTQAHAGQG